MAKNKNATEIAAMISGAGFTAGFNNDLFRRVEEMGGTADDLHRLARPEGRSLIEQMAQLIVDAGKKAQQGFHGHIRLDYVLQGYG